MKGGEELKRALELDPLSLTINTTFGVSYFVKQQYDQAIAQYRKTLEIDPSSLWPRLRLAQAYEAKGSYAEAFSEFDKAVGPIAKIRVASSAALRMAQAFAFSGRASEASKILELWNRSPKPVNASNYDAALIYVGLGKYDQALEMLEQACVQRDSHLFRLKQDPRLERFRTEPRCQALIRRMGLEP